MSSEHDGGRRSRGLRSATRPEGQRGNGDGTIVPLGSCVLDPDGSKGLGIDYLITGRLKLRDFRAAMGALKEAGYIVDFDVHSDSLNVGLDGQRLSRGQQRAHLSGGFFGENQPDLLIDFVNEVSRERRKQLSKVPRRPYEIGSTIPVVAQDLVDKFVRRKVAERAKAVGRPSALVESVLADEVETQPFETDISALVDYYFAFPSRRDRQSVLAALVVGAESLPTESDWQVARYRTLGEFKINAMYGKLADEYASLIRIGPMSTSRDRKLRTMFYERIISLPREQIAEGVRRIDVIEAKPLVSTETSQE